MKELSVLEEIILTAVLRLEDDAYGVTVRRKAAAVTGKDILYGTLYNTLDQLVRKGLLSKTQGRPSAERGGRSKMYYRPTARGLCSLREARALHKQIWKGLPRLSTGD
ncbi:MAG: helix-turn-helix transcriptional regulator [Candidatus Aminicenantes bacterium]|nr:helix-turn-helix transcriptional regulator [Candidatus Aminicenantes bacterium]